MMLDPVTKCSPPNDEYQSPIRKLNFSPTNNEPKKNDKVQIIGKGSQIKLERKDHHQLKKILKKYKAFKSKFIKQGENKDSNSLNGDNRDSLEQGLYRMKTRSRRLRYSAGRLTIDEWKLNKSIEQTLSMLSDLSRYTSSSSENSSTERVESNVHLEAKGI